MFIYLEGMQVILTIAFGICIVWGLLLKRLLKNKDEKIKKIPVYIIGGVILLLELIKQVNNGLGYSYKYLFAIINNNRNDFDTYALPFHFCSFFIFWIIFQLIFMKNKKLSLFFDNMSFLWSLFIVMLLVLYPEMIFGGAVKGFYEGDPMQHTVLFHLLVLLYFSVTLSLRTYHFSLKKIYQAPICILIFGALAIPAAHIFKENYCSIYSCEGWGFLEGVFSKGYLLYNSVLVIIGIIISLILYLAITGVESLRDKIVDDKPFDIGFIGLVIGLTILEIISRSTGFTALEPKYAIYVTILLLISLVPGTIINIIKRKAISL